MTARKRLEIKKSEGGSGTKQTGEKGWGLRKGCGIGEALWDGGHGMDWKAIYLFRFVKNIYKSRKVFFRSRGNDGLIPMAMSRVLFTICAGAASEEKRIEGLGKSAGMTREQAKQISSHEEKSTRSSEKGGIFLLIRAGAVRGNGSCRSSKKKRGRKMRARVAI